MGGASPVWCVRSNKMRRSILSIALIMAPEGPSCSPKTSKPCTFCNGYGLWSARRTTLGLQELDFPTKAVAGCPWKARCQGRISKTWASAIGPYMGAPPFWNGTCIRAGHIKSEGTPRPWATPSLEMQSMGLLPCSPDKDCTSCAHILPGSTQSLEKTYL